MPAGNARTVGGICAQTIDLNRPMCWRRNDGEASGIIPWNSLDGIKSLALSLFRVTECRRPCQARVPDPPDWGTPVSLRGARSCLKNYLALSSFTSTLVAVILY